jgi:hypothetical protein
MSRTAGSDRLVLLFDYPVSRRDLERFGVAGLRALGFDVEIWDFTPFIHPAVHRDVRPPDPVADEHYRVVHSLAEAREALASFPKNGFVLSVLYYHPRALPVYRALGRYGLHYGVVMVNALPRVSVASNGNSRLTRLARLTPAKAVWYVVRHLPYRVLGVPTASLVVAGGSQSLLSMAGLFPISEQTETLWAHSFDYDTYLEERARTSADLPLPYAVFLDEYLPFHPDYKYLNLSPPSTPEAYFPPLCRFFETLERHLGWPVVVAAHPRARYEDHPDHFGGRRVLRGRTAALVRDASLVVAHASSALSFAALFRRPVIFATTPSVSAHPQTGPYVRELARHFGKSPIDITADRVDWAWEQRVDGEAYARYVNEYIKRTATPEKPVWRFLADRLKPQVAAGA